ncbi:MAG: hypothetical protein PHG80_12685 [Methanoregulaceae archaeon]|nr:hypothetical protein [Methanoregulaceae archaeon]
MVFRLRLHAQFFYLALQLLVAGINHAIRFQFVEEDGGLPLVERLFAKFFHNHLL